MIFLSISRNFLEGQLKEVSNFFRNKISVKVFILKGLLAAWIFIFLGLGLLLPFYGLISFWARSIFFSSLNEFLKNLFHPVVLLGVFITLKQAFLSTVISILIGFPLGLWIGKKTSHSLSWQSFFHSLLNMSFTIPTLVAAMAWVFLLGKKGFLSQFGFQIDGLYRLSTLILAHVFYNAPFIAKLIFQSRVLFGESEHLVAKALGASSFQIFKRLIWPKVRISFWIGFCQVMTLCMNSFTLILILGGRPQFVTLETLIYSKLRLGIPDWKTASLFVFWQMGLSFMLWGFTFYLKQKQTHLLHYTKMQMPHFLSSSFNFSLNFPFSFRRNKEKVQVNILQKNKSLILLSFLSLIFIFPYFLLVQWHLPYLSTLKEILPSLWISLQFALQVSILVLLSVFFALIITPSSKKLKKLWFFLMSFPSSFSAFVLSFGFYIFYSRWVHLFDSYLWVVILLQSILLFPFAFRLLWPLMEFSFESLNEAAKTLGAKEWQIFIKLQWPKWRIPVIGVFFVLVGLCLGEVGMMSLFYQQEPLPLTLWIFRNLSKYSFEKAQTVAVILLALSLFVQGLGFLYHFKQVKPPFKSNGQGRSVRSD